MRCVRVAFLAGYRRDADDPSVTALDHVRGDRAAAKEHTKEIHLQHSLPFVRCALPHFLRHTRDARVINENINLSKLLYGRIECPLNGIGLADIDLDPLGGEALRCFRAEIPQATARPGLGEPPGDRQSNSTRSAGHDRNPSLQINLVHAGRIVRTVPRFVEQATAGTFRACSGLNLQAVYR